MKEILPKLENSGYIDSVIGRRGDILLKRGQKKKRNKEGG